MMSQIIIITTIIIIVTFIIIVITNDINSKMIISNSIRETYATSSAHKGSTDTNADINAQIVATVPHVVILTAAASVLLVTMVTG